MSIAGSLRIETFEGSRPHLRLMGFESDLETVTEEDGAPQRGNTRGWGTPGGRQSERSVVVEEFGGCLRAYAR